MRPWVPAELRWAWRTLTSMRTALLLLCLLALAAVPGSLLPQRPVSPADVQMFIRAHPTVAPALDRLYLFDVFASPWFSAVYLLLLISLSGCVLPRTRRLLAGLNRGPAEPPRDLSRMSNRLRIPARRLVPAVTDSTEALLDAAAEYLRSRRFRVRRGAGFVAGEKGRLHEAGNLLFHLSLLLVLAAAAIGHLYGYRGRVVVAEGSAFANTQTQYDEFVPGPWVDADQLTPFSLRLRSFSAAYQADGPQRGAPRQFTARVAFRPDPAAMQRERTLTVNRPLVVDGTKVFLTGHGYAPRFTVRDGTGQVVFSGAVPFLPRDGTMTSFGAVKAPDARPTQLAFEGFFLPTAAIGPSGPFSAFPGAANPQVLLAAFVGDVGLDSGIPQSVYRLDKTGLRQVRVDGKPLAAALRPGETMRLPNAQGSITFDGVANFANFQIARDPGRGLALAAAGCLLVGLLVSLTVRPQRIWVRAAPAEAADRSGVPRPAQAVDVVAAGTRGDGHPEVLTRLAERLHWVVPTWQAPDTDSKDPG
jgi:cytochrome c biogenesis protein